MKIITAIDSCKSPVEACLMFMMTGTIFGENAFAICRGNRVQEGPEAGFRILH